MSPEELLGDWERRTRDQAELTTELSRRMRETTASASSPDGEVHVTVDHTGGLADLQLTARAMYRDPDELARLILDTSRRAQARMAEQMVDVTRTLCGSDSATTAFIADAYTTQFPQAAEEDGDPR